MGWAPEQGWGAARKQWHLASPRRQPENSLRLARVKGQGAQCKHFLPDSANRKAQVKLEKNKTTFLLLVSSSSPSLTNSWMISNSITGTWLCFKEMPSDPQKQSAKVRCGENTVQRMGGVTVGSLTLKFQIHRKFKRKMAQISRLVLWKAILKGHYHATKIVFSVLTKCIPPPIPWLTKSAYVTWKAPKVKWLS